MAKVDHDHDYDDDDNDYDDDDNDYDDDMVVDDDDDNDYIDVAPRFWRNVAKVRPIYFPTISEQI